MLRLKRIFSYQSGYEKTTLKKGGNNLTEYYKGRQIVFKSLVGSHNYNLATPTSDKDYKVFVFPTFDDLYFGQTYKHSTVGEHVDYQAHDIRKLPELLAPAGQPESLNAAIKNGADAVYLVI